jgi:hypothetical protein
MPNDQKLMPNDQKTDQKQMPDDQKTDQKQMPDDQKTDQKQMPNDQKTDQKQMPDDQKTDQKNLAEFVLNQSNETKIITVFEQEFNWDFTKTDAIFEKDFFEGIKRRYGDILLERHRADGWTSERQ